MHYGNQQKLATKTMKIPELPDDKQKRFRGLLSGSRGESFAEIFPNKKKKLLKKIKKLSKK